MRQSRSRGRERLQRESAARPSKSQAGVVAQTVRPFSPATAGEIGGAANDRGRRCLRVRLRPFESCAVPTNVQERLNPIQSRPPDCEVLLHSASTLSWIVCHRAGRISAKE